MRLDVDHIAELVVHSFGFGKVLDAWTRDDSLVTSLLKRGVDACGAMTGKCAEVTTMALPDRLQTLQGAVLPFGDGSFSCVVVDQGIDAFEEAQVISALSELHRVTLRGALLRIDVDATASLDSTRRDRRWWEERCASVGFRKHPAYYRFNSYESLNDDPSPILILLERVPQTANKELTETAQKEYLLHGDMLRVIGRRSDAHCIRYYSAASFVRPGDTVLDAACGLGYGAHILFNNSQAKRIIGVDVSENAIAYARANYGVPAHIDFHVGDVETLRFIDDDSIDFVAAFETIEHVVDPRAYLQELARVLKPSGRIMVCAPNDWTDETGNDPNPFHLSVYNWDRLQKECNEFFILEKAFVEVAGGAMKCHHSPRRWREVDPCAPISEETEWAVFLCMKDPLASAKTTYIESRWSLPNSPDFNVCAYARDYRQPWLVNGMVAIGTRLSEKNRRHELQDRAIKQFDHRSVDYGAALCGRLYEMIERPTITQAEYDAAAASSRAYINTAHPEPHQLRWQVSLKFAAGLLARRCGRLAEAHEFLAACALSDVAVYSPILANRVLDACHWLAVEALGQHRNDDARTWLLRAVSECKRLSSGSWLNISGDETHPLPFGLAEMAQLFDKAGRAAYMLAELDRCEDRPIAIANESEGFLERQISALLREKRQLEVNIAALSRTILSQEDDKQNLGRRIIALQREKVKMRRRPFSVLYDLVVHQALSCFLRANPPVSAAFRAKLARSADKRDPRRSLRD
jgi:ubiquinone/menaquinone biosynthesis C-methylase UbiE